MFVRERAFTHGSILRTWFQGIQVRKPFLQPSAYLLPNTVFVVDVLIPLMVDSPQAFILSNHQK